MKFLYNCFSSIQYMCMTTADCKTGSSAGSCCNADVRKMFECGIKVSQGRFNLASQLRLWQAGALVLAYVQQRPKKLAAAENKQWIQIMPSAACHALLLLKWT